MNHLRKGGLLIAQVHQVAGRLFSKRIKEYGINEINPAQGRILFALWEEDGISIRQLSQKTLLEKSTLTAMLDRLEATGFIMRVPSDTDRRKTIIKRTEKDKALQKHYLAVSEEMIGIFYHGFTEMEIDDFEKKLMRILVNLSQAEKRQ